MLVYKATFPNGKSYIGITIHTLKQRMRSHKCSAFTKKTNCLFHKALRKYGWENIVWEVLFETSNVIQLQNKEQEYIKQNNTLLPNGYNMTLGGEGSLGRTPWNKGLKITGLYLEKIKNIPRKRKSLISINLETNEKQIFNSIKEAANKLNMNYGSLKMAVRRSIPNLGYKFVLLENS